jgi:hypothetical protein
LDWPPIARELRGPENHGGGYARDGSSPQVGDVHDLFRARETAEREEEEIEQG